jgi:hypothetical protein
MPEHEPGGADADRLSGRKREARAARVDEEHPRGATTDTNTDAGPAPSDDPEVASEPMAADTTLSRLGNATPQRVPPGRQLSGDPPG